jgi:tetratricopeptide (TPR) repeat protein
MEASFEQNHRSIARRLSLALLSHLVALCALLMVSSPARAQTDSAIAEAAAHHNRGIELFREGRFEESIASFERAEAIAPTSANLMNLARCNQELGRNAEAVAYLERYLAAVDLTAEQRSRATSLLEGLRAAIAASEAAEAAAPNEGDPDEETQPPPAAEPEREAVEAPTPPTVSEAPTPPTVSEAPTPPTVSETPES